MHTAVHRVTFYTRRNFLRVEVCSDKTRKETGLMERLEGESVTGFHLDAAVLHVSHLFVVYLKQ